jgi:hypothetical protein
MWSRLQKTPTQPLNSAQNLAFFTSLGRLMKLSLALVQGTIELGGGGVYLTCE